jgi:hypothetical protein
MPNRADILKQHLLQSIGLPFAEILPTRIVSMVLAEESVHYRRAVFTPIVTIWVVLFQVLSTDKSLRNTVNRVMAWLTHQKTIKGVVWEVSEQNHFRTPKPEVQKDGCRIVCDQPGLTTGKQSRF